MEESLVDAGRFGEIFDRHGQAIFRFLGRRIGKAASSTTTTCNIFRLLNGHGVPTHFIEQLDAVTFRARGVRMIPLELVARRIATGGFLDRNADIGDGTVFADLVFEVFEKDDANHDPLIAFDFDEVAEVTKQFI